jgi:hypothetical protein
MLKDALRGAIDELPGYRVKQAVFTTYAFEPDFFESSILPLLLPSGEKNLSLHSAVRRLQLESILRAAPIDIDVYFDARVIMPGCPLLPYDMKAMRLQGEFHGKVVLLRLEDEAGHVKCILGAGSANLTQAGWWENIEAWHFAKPFDPSRPPAGILPGVKSLLDFLFRNRQAGKATKVLRRSFSDAASVRAKADDPVFGVFLPGKGNFLEWLREQVKRGSSDARLEVISPYFADSGHAELVQELLATTRCNGVDVWLPVDPWQAGGPAALIEQSCYDALSSISDLRWAQMRDTGLANSREQKNQPRFLHAKIIRQPGRFCFMGSVNFSQKAFRVNFEAGFLFPDHGAPWLKPLADQPSRFLKPAEQACHEGVDDTLPELRAGFNWQTGMLRLWFARTTEEEKLDDGAVSLLDAQGQAFGKRRTLPADVRVKPGDSLYRDLQTNPWIRLAFRDGRKALVWVQQDGLEYRPPPDGLRPDVWRILEMWRGLAGGRSGSQPGDFEALEILLKRRFIDDEAPPEGAPEQDIFEAMAAAHGSFYLLRRLLLEQRERREYYLSAPRPDTLASLVDQLGRPEDEGAPEAVATWVLLQWVTQICSDHKDASAARKLVRRAETYLEALLCRAPLNAVEPKFLAWAQSMFQCDPGKERSVTRSFKETGAGL